MKSDSNIKSRIIEFLSYLKIGQGKFEKNCGISNGTVNNIKDGISSPNLYKIMKAYPALNLNWLIAGEGEMLRPIETNVRYVAPYISEELTGVPYVSASASASFVDSLYSMEYDLETYGVRPEEGEDLTSGEYIVFDVAGDSMLPTIPDGAKILCKQTKEEGWEYATGVVVVIYGKTLTVKRVLKNNLFGKNELILKADNPIHGQVEIQRSEIRAMWQAIRIVSMKIR